MEPSPSLKTYGKVLISLLSLFRVGEASKYHDDPDKVFQFLSVRLRAVSTIRAGGD